ncbi:MAG TPA: 3-oxoacyl-ACP reductase family protein [Planctomycetota bacterium]|nr:3-oxoacyl-ACP reductase family protein [Planctomycetota bacterium]
MFALDLVGRTAVVTGASQGLGLATAQALHVAGANVVMTYVADAAGANRALAESAAGGLGDRALAVPGDVRDAAAVDAVLAAAIARFGALDIVVNNAGIISDRTVAKMTAEAWQAVIDTNLTGVFNVCKAATGRLADGGRIVNLASISAAIGFFGQANYAAAKAGVIALTKVLSRELASRAITVNAVAPGVVRTDMIRSIPAEASVRMLANIPLQRFGEPREIAEVVLFLCSGSASYVTGQTIHVNGGWWG